LTAAAAGGCPACGADALRPWRSVETFDRRSEQMQYELDRCEACGSAVTRGRGGAEAGRLHRGGAYAPAHTSLDRLLEPLRRIGDRTTLAALGPVERGTTVVDIGAGDGRLVSLLRARGCEVHGVEPFVESADPAIAATTVENADLPEGSADVVVLWHVIEHLDTPYAAVDRAMRTLRPGGRLVVSVPSLDSVQAKLGGNCWFHLDVPRHTTHFTRAGVIRLLERCGLRVIHVGGTVLDQNLLGMAQTLLNRLTIEPNVAFRALKGDVAGTPRRDIFVSALAAAPAVVGGSLAETAAMLMRRPGSIVVRAVRRDS
jgi:SAM-dependent methyltransferase